MNDRSYGVFYFYRKIGYCMKIKNNNLFILKTINFS